MGYQSSDSPTFQNTVAEWIGQRREVLAMIRFSHAGGLKSFEFFDRFDSFKERLGQLPSRTCVIIFRQPQLPLRGAVDDDFIRRALDMIPEGAEYLITGLTVEVHGTAKWFPSYSDLTRADFLEDLQVMRGKPVAVGIYPPWLHDSEEVLSAVIPNADGSATTGVY